MSFLNDHFYKMPSALHCASDFIPLAANVDCDTSGMSTRLRNKAPEFVNGPPPTSSRTRGYELTSRSARSLRHADEPLLRLLQ